MDLFNVTDVTCDAVTSEMIRDVHETARKVNELRPLPQDLIESVHRDFVGERVYSSNAIEGNTYTLGETIEILKTGYIDLGRKREATEVINLGKAIEFVQSRLIGDSDPYSEHHLLNLHKILLSGIDDSIAGRYRDRRVMILGAKHQPPSERDVERLMSSFFAQLQKQTEVEPIVLASWAHWSIARVHPFVDGNGRVSRLWQDLILFRRRLTCAIIPPDSKREYIESLAVADEGDFNLLMQLTCRRVAATFDRYLAAQQKVDSVSQWAQELVGEATVRASEKRRLEYLRWRREMEALRYEFERCAATITHMSPDTQIQFKTFEILDQATWENIRSGIGTGKTWFFQIIFRRDRRAWSYTFFFGNHFPSDLDTVQDKSEPRVCLLIGEQIDRGESIRLDLAQGCPLTLKEVFVANKTFVRRRFAPDQASDTLDHDVDSATIAQDFIREVMLHRMG